MGLNWLRLRLVGRAHQFGERERQVVIQRVMALWRRSTVTDVDIDSSGATLLGRQQALGDTTGTHRQRE